MTYQEMILVFQVAYSPPNRSSEFLEYFWECNIHENQSLIDINSRFVRKDLRYKLPCDNFGDSRGVVTSESPDGIPVTFEKLYVS